MKEVTEIVVISGKGGTGKTSLTSSFAVLGGSSMVVADCDVDAADMHLLLNPTILHEEDFYSGKTAVIETEGCVHCFKCKNVCRFDAIHVINGDFVVDELNCEGCSYCYHICPTHTIKIPDALSGKFFISKSRLDNTLVHARLKIAADNSGKLVTKVRDEAKRVAAETGKKVILVDGPPGIGCPVVASLTGTDFAVIVTEPTVSGLHDLQRVAELVAKMKIPAGVIINKSDLNLEMSGKIKNAAKELNLALIAELPYDEVFTKAITQGKTIVEYDHGNIEKKIKDSWKKIMELSIKEQ
jgi:MinD superfamily P-loop ATPase